MNYVLEIYLDIRVVRQRNRMKNVFAWLYSNLVFCSIDAAG